MFRRFINITAITLAAAALLSADFSYQESSKITGGMMASMMKVAGVFSKAAREPIQSTVSVKGDKMVRRGTHSMEIIDLSSETITTVDMQKKTYSVMTFAQFRQMMDEMAQKMKDKRKKDDPEMKFKVSAAPTGNSRNISGFDAKEMLVKIDMEVSDQKNSQKGALVVTSRVWIAPSIPGYSEMRDFYMKMAQKLQWAPGGNMFAANPEIGQGMAEAYKEISKLDGAPVLQTMSMGPEGSAPPDSTAAQPAPQASQQPKPSVGGALGGALGGRFGLGGKKKEQQDAPPADNSGNPPAQSASLIDMTTEYTNFSTAPVDPGAFSVPAGFKEVKPDMKK